MDSLSIVVEFAATARESADGGPTVAFGGVTSQERERVTSQDPSDPHVQFLRSSSMKSILRARYVVPATICGGTAWFFRCPQPPSKSPPAADNDLFLNARAGYLSQLPTSTLMRSLCVHSFCTHPRLVDFGISVMHARGKRSVPILDSLI